jgi:hypothetical protein
MARHIAALILSATAAAYLGAFFLLLSALLAQNSLSEVRSFQGLYSFIGIILYFGTFSLLIYGLPILLFACVAAFIITKLRMRSLTFVMAAGSLIGFGFGLYFNRPDFLAFIPGLTFSGAICGLIYWRVAICPSQPLDAPDQEQA